jgi:alpha-L-fucosidase
VVRRGWGRGWRDEKKRKALIKDVPIQKHHDGFSLFDTGNTTHRSSVYLGPKRDLVAELLDTAEKQAPQLRRGTYYSLPEWYSFLHCPASSCNAS